jgi:hypothetical protein
MLPQLEQSQEPTYSIVADVPFLIMISAILLSELQFDNGLSIIIHLTAGPELHNQVQLLQ